MKMSQIQLYFGTQVADKPDRTGYTIKPEEFMEFFDQWILPNVPGATLVEGIGMYAGDFQVYRELAIIVTLILPVDFDKDKILGFREEYCRRFSQESVMQVVSEVDVDF